MPQASAKRPPISTADLVRFCAWIVVGGATAFSKEGRNDLPHSTAPTPDLPTPYQTALTSTLSPSFTASMITKGSP